MGTFLQFDQIIVFKVEYLSMLLKKKDVSNLIEIFLLYDLKISTILPISPVWLKSDQTIVPKVEPLSTLSIFLFQLIIVLPTNDF